MDTNEKKKNDQLFHLMFLFLHFHHPNVLDNMCDKQKWHLPFFTSFKLVVYVLACARAIACIKWITLLIGWKTHLQPLWHHRVQVFVTKCECIKWFLLSQWSLLHRIYFCLDEIGCFQQLVNNHCWWKSLT